MRRSLGKIIAWVVVLNTALWGVGYQWSVLESPKTLRVGQSALVRYACTFDESAAEYSIKLNSKENTEYTMSILSEHNQVVKGKRIDTFDIVITPKLSGKVEVNLEGSIEYVPPGAIDYNAHLGRDNISKNDIVITKTTLPSVVFESLPNSAALSGNITMEVRTDRTCVRAFEPLHLTLSIKGSGNFDQFIPYELNISGVKVFSEPPQKLLSPSKEGVEGEIRQEFALVAEKSYVIPSFTLNLFDTLHNRHVLLKSKAIKVEVNEGYDPSSLLDAPVLADTSALKRYGLYGGLVLLGVLLSEGARRLWKHRPRRKEKQFWDSAKSSKELVMLLSLSGEKRFASIVAQLEEGKILLGEAKKKLDKLTTDKEVNQ